MKLIASADTDCESKRASNSHVFCCNLVTSYQHSTLLYTIVVYTLYCLWCLPVASASQCRLQSGLWISTVHGVVAHEGSTGRTPGRRSWAQKDKVQLHTSKHFKNLRFKNLRFKKCFLSENICAFRILFGSELADRMRPPWAMQQAWSFSLQ